MGDGEELIKKSTQQIKELINRLLRSAVRHDGPKTVAAESGHALKMSRLASAPAGLLPLTVRASCFPR